MRPNHTVTAERPGRGVTNFVHCELSCLLHDDNFERNIRKETWHEGLIGGGMQTVSREND